MRFVNLEVSWFQGVRSARVDFGPGLNILYGPNDLGKSTLATAIRAALLLQTNSAEADLFHPWHVDEKATVTLVFVDLAGNYWRVKKTFGGPSGAQLWFSKDGENWSADAKAREVDEKLRSLLPWGIAAPGGKGGPRGWPESFLRNALLGAQGEVERILSTGLDDDSSDSGKVALTAALSALAEDPLFKKVVAIVQSQFDRFFTEKGSLKRGQSSPIALASDSVKKLQTERDGLSKHVAEAQLIEQSALQLQQRRTEIAADLDVARAGLAKLQKRMAKDQARQAVVEKVNEVQDELAKVDAHVQQVQTATAAVGNLTIALETNKAALAGVHTTKQSAEAAVKAAEEVVRQALSGESAKQRELERAQLEAKSAKLTEERGRLEALAASALAAARVQDQLTEARSTAANLSAESLRLAEARQHGLKALDGAEYDVQLAEGIVAYGRWRVACEAAAGAAGAHAEAATLNVEADRKEAAARELEARAVAELEGAALKQAALPTDAQVAALQKLARDKDLAEAALGGGVTVTVRPRSPIAFKSIADSGQAVDKPALSSESVIEADRRIQLSIGELVDIEVTAGAPEKRRALDALRRRWKEEALPFLEKAGVATLADLETRHAALNEHAATATDLRVKAQTAKMEADALRGKAAVLERQAPLTEEELQAKEARIGNLPRDILNKFYASMGATWEAQCEQLRIAKTNVVKSLQISLAEIEGNQKKIEWELQDAKKRETEAAAQLPSLLEPLGGQTPAVVTEKVTVELNDNATAAEQLSTALENLGDDNLVAVEVAKQGLKEAGDILQARDAEAARAQENLTEAQAQLQARQAELRLLEDQLAAMNRDAVALRLGEVRNELSAFGDAEGLTEFDVRTAELEVQRFQELLEQVKEEYLKADGALTSFAAPMTKERVQQLEEAINAAEIHERELVIDAESWKLLRDALRDAEKTESAHLGKALAVPVAQHFAELTQGKYAGVAIDQDLRMESVLVNGMQTSGEAVLEALSVGTKDQLATLVRLAVASQLKAAILLDDQLVHTDPTRLAWFADVLRKVTQEKKQQVVVFTCRPLDYVEELQGSNAMRGPLHLVDLARVVQPAS